MFIKFWLYHKFYLIFSLLSPKLLILALPYFVYLTSINSIPTKGSHTLHYMVIITSVIFLGFLISITKIINKLKFRLNKHIYYLGIIIVLLYFLTYPRSIYLTFYDPEAKGVHKNYK